MKNLLLIAMLATSLSSFAQYSKSYNSNKKFWNGSEVRVAQVALIGTYICVSEIPNTTYGERTAMAFTGMITSYAFYKGFKYIREHNTFKSNYKLFKKHKRLLCKR